MLKAISCGSMRQRRPWSALLCPLKLDRSKVEFSAVTSWLGGAEGDKGIDVFRRAEGVHSEAGDEGDAGGGYLLTCR